MRRRPLSPLIMDWIMKRKEVDAETTTGLNDVIQQMLGGANISPPIHLFYIRNIYFDGNISPTY